AAYDVAPLLVGNSGLRVGRERRIGDSAAQEIERLLERAIVLLVRRHIGLRAGLFVAFRLEVAAAGRLALGISPRLEILRHFLQHLDVGRNALGLDGTARWREITRRGQ